MHKIYTLLLAITLACFPLIASSHHSFSAEFDIGSPVEVTGTVTHVEWTNPHAWFHLDVEDENGNIEKWKIEMLGINALVRSGISPKTIEPGDLLTITGYGARDGTNTANAASLTLTETGETLWESARN